MIVKQFLDEPLAQYGYAIVSDGEMAVIDPGRNAKPYLDLAQAPVSYTHLTLPTTERV